MTRPDEKQRLRRVMGLADLLLFFVITGFAVPHLLPVKRRVMT
jgi:hypothetical protein